MRVGGTECAGRVAGGRFTQSERRGIILRMASTTPWVPEQCHQSPWQLIPRLPMSRGWRDEGEKTSDCDRLCAEKECVAVKLLSVESSSATTLTRW